MTDCTRFEASIVDFLEESLAPGEHADLAAHAAACARCTATLRAYRHIESAYQARAELEVRPELAARILAGSRAEARPARSRKRLVLLLVAAGLALLFTPLAYDYMRAPAQVERTAGALLADGDRLRDSGQLAEARATYERAMAQAPADLRAEVLHRLAQVAELGGDLPGALQLLEEVCEAHGDYDGRESALLQRAALLARLQRHDEALQAYARVRDEFPGSAGEIERRVRELAGEVQPLEALGYGGGIDDLQGLGYIGD